MEAFDIIQTLSRYYGYTANEAKLAYHLLLQAEALEPTACPHLTGVMCFYRMHDPQIAYRIRDQVGLIEDLVFDMANEKNEPLPDVVLQTVTWVWVHRVA